jgi:hypothetical protein
MKKSPWVANIDQEISCLSRNPEIHFRFLQDPVTAP